MNISRRQFLKLNASVALSWYARPLKKLMGTSQYWVGVSNLADPYTATLRAVEASGEWPNTRIANKTVVIKPNLVIGMTSDTGITTDPEVVRALVDLALLSGAASVLIVESGANGASFSSCGYDFFNNYDSYGRVMLIDLDDQPLTLAEVPYGLVYKRIYMPKMLLTNDIVFISVAKLKCHINTMVTLTMKNLFGLVPIKPYQDSWVTTRTTMHKRGVNQTIVDLNLLRPIDFAVVDGIWAMEGNGPIDGNPVKTNLVLAGSNALAVDRVCLDAMGILQNHVQHFIYAASRGLGPSDLTMVRAVGDPLPFYTFIQPNIGPIVVAPKCIPKIFYPNSGQKTYIIYHVDRTCRTRVEILRLWETKPEIEYIRTLHDWRQCNGNTEILTWDGRDDEGNRVYFGRYSVRVCADTGASTRKTFTSSWVWVMD